MISHMNLNNLSNNPGNLGGMNYREIELSVIARLKDLHEIASRLGLDQSQKTIGSILKDIEQHSFKIAVVGEFRRGKSTFINALLGKDILPSDILPTTATINRVTYGPTPTVRIIYKARADQPERAEEIDFSELSNYVTKLTPESESLAAMIEEAVITYPTPYCRNNVDIIDTPGLNDNVVLTDVTKSVLPKAHAAVLIVQAISPLSISEMEFIDYLLDQGIGKVIFVVSGIDRIEEGERSRIVQHISQRIRHRLNETANNKFPGDAKARDRYIDQAGEVKVFGVSGLLALKGKSTANEDLLRASGFDEIESALHKLITEESGAIALQSWLKQIRIIGEQLIGQIDIQVKQCNDRIQKVNYAYSIGSTLAETLREILAQESQLIEKRAHDTLSHLTNLSARLEKDLVTEINKVIADYPINDEDYSAQKNDAFHSALAQKLQTRLLESTMRIAAAIQNSVNEDFEKTRGMLMKTAITFDRVVEHISYSTSSYREQPENHEEKVQLGEEISNCSPIGVEAVNAPMVITPMWESNVFRNNRLPVGSFNWASKKMKNMSFRANLTLQSGTEIKHRMIAQEVERKVSEVIHRTFGQFKTRMERARKYAEESQFGSHSQRERATTLLEYNIKDLEKMRSRIIQIAGGV